MIALIDKNNIVLNVIMATPEEAIEAFGGVWVECPTWVGIGMDINTPEPAIQTIVETSSEPTKTELMAEFAALTAKIQALQGAK